MKIKYILLFLILPLLVSWQIKALHFKNNNIQLSVNATIFEELLRNDFSVLWTKTDNSQVFGFIGNNYQRIRIKFTSVVQDEVEGQFYYVAGKSMVKGNICDFKGKITIVKIRQYKYTSGGVDNEYRNKVKNQYSLTGTYLFSEDKTQNHAGVFKGVFQSDFYTDFKGKIHYDDIDIQADGFSNNQFVGIWRSYNNKISKICNWGDYRIPNAGSFDQGAGEFSPNTKDVSLGWQSYIDQMKSPLAKKEEQRPWWK